MRVLKDSDVVVRKVLSAARQLAMRGVEPSRVTLQTEEFVSLAGIIGFRIFGMEILSGDENAVYGRRKHGEYEVVPWEREDLPLHI